MKRVLALALALVLSLSMGVVAFAADEYVPGDLSLNGPTDPTLPYIAPKSTTKILIEVIDTSVTSVNQTILDAKSAALALDDNYIKVAFKALKGAEYIKSYEFKKSGNKELYLELVTIESYLGKVYDLSWEIKVTVTKPAKIGEAVMLSTLYETSANHANGVNNGYATTGALATSFTTLFGTYVQDPAAARKVIVSTTAPTATLKNNDYVLKEYNRKYGWNEEKKIGEGSGATAVPQDFTYVSDPGFDSVSQKATAANISNVQYIHIKKGLGEVSCMDFGDNAYVEVKFADQPAINMYYSESAIKEITAKYADTDFQFWNWRGKPAFDFTATVELTIDEDLVGEEPVLYYYDGTNLTKVTSFDLDDGVYTIKTRQLGAFVAASKEIVKTTAPVETTAAGAAPAGTGNPKTGVSDFVGVAVALAVVSMAAAGAVALKK